MAGEVAALGGVIAVAVISSRAADWSSPELAVLLFGLGLVGDRLMVTVRGQQLSAAFIAFVLAMTLMGPAPAVFMGAAIASIDALVRRIKLAPALNNVTTVALFMVVGALLTRLLLGDIHHSASSHVFQGPLFGVVVFGVSMVTNVVNFAGIALNKFVSEGRSVFTLARRLFVPILPGQIAAAALAAVLAVAYTNLGYTVLLGVVIVISVFQYLALALLRSEERAEQLAARTHQMATLQLGVLVTLVETLELRDKTTARHAAAVARYSRALAAEIGCTPEQQDIVHTAGLLHDIGKFALPERVLRASELGESTLSEADLRLVRLHPQHGATLVGRLDGYGPVAEAILYHHEQIDGSGYPAGLIGPEIPLLSRILAVCNTYDALLARHAEGSNRTPDEAMTELEQLAGRKLDADAVTRFVAMLRREGVSFIHADDLDFEAELDFERRARSLAQPARS